MDITHTQPSTAIVLTNHVDVKILQSQNISDLEWSSVENVYNDIINEIVGSIDIDTNVKASKAIELALKLDQLFKAFPELKEKRLSMYRYTVGSIKPIICCFPNLNAKTLLNKEFKIASFGVDSVEMLYIGCKLRYQKDKTTNTWLVNVQSIRYV